MHFLSIISLTTVLTAGLLHAKPYSQDTSDGAELHGPRALEDSAVSSIERRTVTGQFCNVQGWPPAPVPPLREFAYPQFYGNNNMISISAQKCRQAWCGYSAAVFICNNNLGFVEVNAEVAADHMNMLLDGNTGCLEPYNNSLAQGQVFNAEGWNLIVRGDDECPLGETNI
ncbi:hypothetical protein F5Y16DRAFT_161548 [Xylariaceae sp. FL0255]|nr:hypothetical protein F5Y16DRAFT_161548 [Xylariaceae sp. FL0255]